MTRRQVYLVVAACALLPHLGALGNGFAWDDRHIIVDNALVHAPDGVWRAFTSTYWPPEWNDNLYRPLVIASYALEWAVSHGPLLFHALNLVWHVAATLAVALLVGWAAGDTAALIGGAIFAVHPVHVEAVANVVGRAELMAAAFACLAVWLALARDRLGWSLAAWVLGLLCKENAVVVPALVAAAWLLGIGRPPARRMAVWAAAWVALGAGYGVVRELVIAPYFHGSAMAPVFLGQSATAIRLTGVSAFADVVRLLVLPLTLRADYSPAERTIVQSAFDPRFILGLTAFAAWALVTLIAWRRDRRVEAWGLLWIGIAYFPVANLVFPTGIYVAERTLYLPSVGLALALGSWLAWLRPRAVAAGRRALLDGAVAAAVLAGAARSALRVPVWKSDHTVLFSILNDSPDSYQGPLGMAAAYLEFHAGAKALDAARDGIAIYPYDGRLYLMGAHGAYEAGRYGAADSLLAGIDALCGPRCVGLYRVQAASARRLSEPAVADSLLAHAAMLEARGRVPAAPHGKR